MHETENASEPDPKMAMMLELSDQEFKTTRICRLRDPVEKVDSMHKHMGDIRDETCKKDPERNA